MSYHVDLDKILTSHDLSAISLADVVQELKGDYESSAYRAEHSNNRSDASAALLALTEIERVVEGRNWPPVDTGQMIPADELAEYLRAVIAYDEHRWEVEGEASRSGRIGAFRNLLAMVDPYEPENGGFRGAAAVVSGLLADEVDRPGYNAQSVGDET